MKYKLYRMLCVAMSIGSLCLTPFAVLADEQEGTSNVDETVIIISPGQSGTQSSGNINSNTTESSNESPSETTGSLNESSGGGGGSNEGTGGGGSNEGTGGGGSNEGTGGGGSNEGTGGGGSNEGTGGGGSNEGTGGGGSNEGTGGENTNEDSWDDDWNNNPNGDDWNNNPGGDNSTSTYTPTEAEKGAYNEQSAVNRVLKNVISDIQSNEEYSIGGLRSDSSEVVTYGYASLSESDIRNITDHIESFQEYLTQQDGLDQSVDIYDEVNNLEHPQQQLEDLQGDWESLTSEMKEQVKSAIAEQQGFAQDFIEQNKYIVGNVIPVQGYDSQTSTFNFHRDDTPPFSIQTNFSGVGAYRGPYTGVRTDLISGGFQDFNSWSDRFTALTRYLSNSMSDFCNVGYIKEYHISNVSSGEIQVVNYTSDLRRWRIYNKDTGELMYPQGADSDGYIYTNNPQHALSTTFHQSGHYRIVAEQQAIYYLRTTVSYDICEYLFDIETRNLLYFNEKTVSNGSGGSVDLSGEQREGWVKTGDVFNWTVNDLGEIETDGSAIQRVE